MVENSDNVTVNINVTDPEIEVVKLLSSGMKVPEIAAKIGQNRRSVEYIIQQLKTRVQTNTAAGVVAFFIRNNII